MRTLSKCILSHSYLRPIRNSVPHMLVRPSYCCTVLSGSFLRGPVHQSVLLPSGIISSSRSFSDKRSCTSPVSTSLKTHSCNCLRVSDVGQEAVLRGFVAFNRLDKFVLIRDAHGMTQIVVEKLYPELKDLTLESYIEVVGTVRARPQGQENPSLATGAVEVEADRVTVLSRASEPLPFLVRPHNVPREALGLRHRHLHLRFPYMQRNLRLRSQVMKKMSDFLEDEEGFVNVTTPTLGPHTDGGAQLFMVPYCGRDSDTATSPPGHQRTQTGRRQYYCLTQSPQTYKQLLMLGGLDRYYQFALCYRDETARPDRQPEFMQLDLEISDVTAQDIHSLVERLLQRCWPDERYRDTAGPAPNTPFPRITYNEAMRKYGTDKPDTRFDWQLCDVSAVLLSEGCRARRLSDTLHEPHCSAWAFVVPAGRKLLHKSAQKTWDNLARKDHQLSGVSLLDVLPPISSDKSRRSNTMLAGALARLLDEQVSQQLVEQLGATPGDTIVLAAGNTDSVLSLLGRLRLIVADALEASGEDIRDKTRRQFLWVVDFPLFERSKEGGGLQSVHHPFTAPHPDDAHLLDTDPLQVRSLHYDLVCDGCEVGGGSVRVHDSALQQRMLELVGLPLSDLAYFIEALTMGAPPHAGIALGVERLVALLSGSPTIRDVTAFPKTGLGRCLLTKAPGPVGDELLRKHRLLTPQPPPSSS